MKRRWRNKMIYSNVIDMIGKTPLFAFPKEENNSQIFAKLEMFNPGSSVKDRPAYEMIKTALENGQLSPNGTIIEATSGNTGIALAMIGASLKLQVIIVMPESMSVERRKLIQSYGAKLVLTPAAGGMQAAVDKAIALQKEIDNSMLVSQFDNLANPESHYLTTGPEIIADLKDQGGIDVFVSAFGTGGTATGITKALKEFNPNVFVVGVEPKASPLITEGQAGPHKIQGIGANFVPNTLDLKQLNEVVTVTDQEAITTSQMLAKEYGLLVGISSGAAFAATKKLAQRPEFANKNIVTVFPDTGQRYLSTALFDFAEE